MTAPQSESFDQKMARMERLEKSHATLEELSKVLKVELHENTVVVFKAPRDECRRVSESLNHMPVWERYGITPVACPDDFEIVVIPGNKALGGVS